AYRRAARRCGRFRSPLSRPRPIARTSPPSHAALTVGVLPFAIDDVERQRWTSTRPSGPSTATEPSKPATKIRPREPEAIAAGTDADGSVARRIPRVVKTTSLVRTTAATPWG